MAESAGTGEWGPPVRIRNERDNSDVVPILLSISPQRKILECDSEGNVLVGLLPFAAQAALFKWNHRLYSDIQFFPGTGGDIFDPMLGDPYPASFAIEFSLPDAPEGITISEGGVIMVAADAALDDENSITVQAIYQGETYTAVLFITRDRRSSAPRYLGTIHTLPQTAEVMIIKGPVVGSVRARQGDFVLAVASGTAGSHTWQTGRVYQWTGLAWEYRTPDQHTDLYIRSFADGLEEAGLTQDMGWFGAIFAKTLIAQRAFIATLETQILKISGVIYGGNRFDANGNVVDPDSSGWHLGPDGTLRAFRGIFNNIELTADSFEITAGNKGFLPVGFVYFQLRGQPKPGDLFSGIWEDVSANYAGLFFRVEGGNAVPFGEDQGMMIQSHRHTNRENSQSSFPSGTGSFGTVGTPPGNSNTGWEGGVETRPVNTTIRVWVRKS